MNYRLSMGFAQLVSIGLTGLLLLSSRPLVASADPPISELCRFDSFSGPSSVVAGSPCFLKGRITNFSEAHPASFEAPLFVQVNLGGLVGYAFVWLPGTSLTENRKVTLDPGKAIDLGFDLAQLTFVYQKVLARHNARGQGGLYEAIYDGKIQCLVFIRNEEGPVELESESVTVQVEVPPNDSVKDLELAIVVSGKESPNPSLLASLTNRSDKPLRIKKRLMVPTDLFLSIEATSGQKAAPQGIKMTLSLEELQYLREHPPSVMIDGPSRRSQLPTGHSWILSRFENHNGLVADDFESLGPGESVQRLIDFTELIKPRLASGRYRFTAIWRSFDNGSRFAPDGPPAVIGRIESEPTEVEIGGP